MIFHLNALADLWLGSLWKASWQGGVALLIVWSICRFVPRIGPTFKMWLWRLAWIKLLLSFFWNSSIDLPLLAPLPPVYSPRTAQVLHFEGAVPELAAAPVIKPKLNANTVLFMIWIAAVLGGAVRLGYELRRSRRLKRKCSPVANDVLGELCSRLGLRKLPALLQSSDLSAPVLVGIFRPVIIVPADVKQNDLRMMLTHELAHVKRRDLMWGWLPAICHALFFFHPLLWLTRREWLLAQEMACDELALRHSATSPASFANMLIDLAAGQPLRPRFGTIGIFETTQNLKRRILAMKMIGIRKSRQLMMALLVASVTGVLPWRIVAQDNPEDAAKRIQQLEKENAELRGQVEKLKQGDPRQNVRSEDLRALEAGRLAQRLAAEISAAEADLKVLRGRYTDDHPAVVEAQKRLQRLKEHQGVPDSKRKAQERELYLEELALAQKYSDSMHKQMQAGRGTFEELVRAQRQVYGIQREIAKLEGDRAKLREVVQEEMKAVQRLLKEAQKRVEVGTAPPRHDLDLQREMLKLKRELLQLDEP